MSGGPYNYSYIFKYIIIGEICKLQFSLYKVQGCGLIVWVLITSCGRRGVTGCRHSMINMLWCIP